MRKVVRVRVPNPVWAPALHEPPVVPPVQRPVAHRVWRRGVHGTAEQTVDGLPVNPPQDLAGVGDELAHAGNASRNSSSAAHLVSDVEPIRATTAQQFARERSKTWSGATVAPSCHPRKSSQD